MADIVNFRVQDLMVTVNVQERQFMVECGTVSVLEAASCGGNTRRFLEVNVADTNRLEALKAQLRNALDALNRVRP